MDKNERDFFCFVNILPEIGLIIDAGANIGIMSYHLAKKRPKSLIYSYEPIPINNSIINFIKLIFKLTNCIINNNALSNQSEELTMLLPEISSVQEQGLSHVMSDHRDKNSPVQSQENGKKFKVQANTIDEVFLEDGHLNQERREEHLQIVKQSSFPTKFILQVTGIKIDVENYEWFVLKGAEQILSLHSPIVYCELWPNEQRTKCIELMESHDYSMYVAVNSRKMMLFDAQKHDKHNFLFIPNKKIEQMRHLII